MSKKTKRLAKEVKALRRALDSLVKTAASPQPGPDREAPQAPQATGPALPPVLPWATYNLAQRTALKKQGGDLVVNPFDATTFHKPMPGVLPKGYDAGKHGLAMDSTVIEVSAWSAVQVYNSAFFNGQTFMGYTYLAELAQRPEYRRPIEVLATESTRKWIKYKSKSNDAGKADKIKQLEKEEERLGVQGCFRRMSEGDGFFGRMHLFIDLADPATGRSCSDDAEELKSPIGDGYDATSEAKVTQGSLLALRPIEPLWCYPAFYNSTQPLKKGWYDPQTWYVMGTEVHKTRLLRFVAREVPDQLKPSYQFGGLSMSQMAKPYVDNWLRTRQSVADLIWSFSTMILKTNMAALNQPGSELLMTRLQIFSNLRTNQDLMVLNKDEEDFDNISVPLSTLDALQAQSQEHMCSVTATPVVKLLGIQPAGLNASSEGELTVWYDNNAAYQEWFYDPHLTTVVGLMQLNLWGEVDEDIVHEWLPIEELSEEQAANVQKTKAETDASLVTTGAIDEDDVRARLDSDSGSDYAGKLSGPAPGPPQQGQEGMPPGGAEEDAEDDQAIAELFPRLASRDRLERARDQGRRDGGREPRDREPRAERDDRTRQREPAA